ncbi:hypothetical protein F5X96DRAFT_692851 [Biscogniauxia mediterranea]|nr:hypothetical protein F5X96DRAFT_692851 [Biscogniauxia mediterranea]
MSHSPLHRTVMRSVLDRRTAALADYEIALETSCQDAHDLPPPARPFFDADGWAECRKAHDAKKARDAARDESRRLFVKAFNAETRAVRARPKSARYRALRAMFKTVLPSRDAAVKLAVARSGFLDWRPRAVADCLRGEDDYSLEDERRPSRGRVAVGDRGEIAWRALHLYVSPRFVPRPHFYHERRRLAAKSAEFADFVAAQAVAPPGTGIAIPRPEDDTSDGGLRSDPDEDDDEDEEEVVLTRTSRGLTATKRKRGGGGASSSSSRKKAKTENKKKNNSAAKGQKQKQKKKPTARKPPRFTKTFDSAVHDRAQLLAQTRNRFTLMQQRVPRVEVPGFETVAARRRAASSTSLAPPSTSKPPTSTSEEETETEKKEKEMTTLYGIALPVRLDQEEEEAGPRSPTEEEAWAYRAWRRGGAARAFFAERDAYMRARVLKERVPDRELVRAAQRLVGFWTQRQKQRKA